MPLTYHFDYTHKWNPSANFYLFIFSRCIAITSSSEPMSDYVQDVSFSSYGNNVKLSTSKFLESEKRTSHSVLGDNIVSSMHFGNHMNVG